MDQTVYWLWITLKRHISLRKIQALYRSFGSMKAVYEAGKEEYQNTHLLQKEELNLLLDKDLFDAEEELALSVSCQIQLVPFDSNRYPERLKELPDPPAVLYLRGDATLLTNYPAITMVGPRRCSGYGGETALRLAGDLASAGVVVISGMAEGIDGASHAGALRVHGKTIAVLGCGIDVDYPMPNLELKEQVAESGLLISEFPLGTPAYRQNFPFRNRVLSALSDGVLVVEAGRRSGALITASCAAEQGKDVYAVPGMIREPNSEGVLDLIESGAIMVRSAGTILDHLLTEQRFSVEKSDSGREEKAESFSLPERKPMPKVEQDTEGLSEEERCILALCETEIGFDALCEETGLDSGTLGSRLIMLEMNGYILKLPGKRYRKQ